MKHVVFSFFISCLLLCNQVWPSDGRYVIPSAAMSFDLDGHVGGAPAFRVLFDPGLALVRGLHTKEWCHVQQHLYSDGQGGIVSLGVNKRLFIQSVARITRYDTLIEPSVAITWAKEKLCGFPCEAICIFDTCFALVGEMTVYWFYSHLSCVSDLVDFAKIETLKLVSIEHFTRPITLSLVKPLLPYDERLNEIKMAVCTLAGERLLSVDDGAHSLEDMTREYLEFLDVKNPQAAAVVRHSCALFLQAPHGYKMSFKLAFNPQGEVAVYYMTVSQGFDDEWTVALHRSVPGTDFLEEIESLPSQPLQFFYCVVSRNA